MTDFQEQAKNWLRNVVKQNPDKIKAGMEKAGDLIDKQTGGKYAEKVDSVQEKVGNYVDSHAQPADSGVDQSSGPGTSGVETQPEAANSSPAEPEPSATDSSSTEPSATESSPAESSADSATSDSAGETVDEADSGAEETVDEASPDAVDGTVVGGETPDVASNPSSSAGSGTEGVETGATATGTSDGGLPGPR